MKIEQETQQFNETLKNNLVKKPKYSEFILNKLMEKEIILNDVLEVFFGDSDIGNVLSSMDVIHSINLEILDNDTKGKVIQRTFEILQALLEAQDIDNISKCVDIINNINPEIFSEEPFNQFIDRLFELLKQFLVNFKESIGNDICANNILKCIDIINNINPEIFNNLGIVGENFFQELNDILEAAFAGNPPNIDNISKCVDIINNINPDIFNEEPFKQFIDRLFELLGAAFAGNPPNIDNISKCVDIINNINPDIFNEDPFNQFISRLFELLGAAFVNSNIDNISKCVDIIINFMSIIDDELIVEHLPTLIEISDQLIQNNDLILKGLDIISIIISNDYEEYGFDSTEKLKQLLEIITSSEFTIDAILKSINIIFIIVSKLDDVSVDDIQESLDQCIENVISKMSEMDVDGILKCLDIIIMISYDAIDLVTERFVENTELLGQLLETDDIYIKLKCLDIIDVCARYGKINSDLVDPFLEIVKTILTQDTLDHNDINIVLKYLDIITLSITEDTAQNIHENIIEIINSFDNDNYKFFKNVLLKCLDILNDILEKITIDDGDDIRSYAELVSTKLEIEDPEVVSKVLEISNKVIVIYSDENVFEKFQYIIEHYTQYPNIDIISCCIDIIININNEDLLGILYEIFDSYITSIFEESEDDYIKKLDMIQLIVSKNKELGDGIREHLNQCIGTIIGNIDEDNIQKCLDVIIIISHNAIDLVTDQFGVIIESLGQIFGQDDFNIKSKCLDIIAAIAPFGSIVPGRTPEQMGPIQEILSGTLVPIQEILSGTLVPTEQEMYQTYTNIISKGLYILVISRYEDFSYPEYLLGIEDKEIIIDFLKSLEDIRIRNNPDVKKFIINIILGYAGGLLSSGNEQTPDILVQMVRTFSILCGGYDSSNGLLSFDDNDVNIFIHDEGVKGLIERVYNDFYEYSKLESPQ